MFVTLLLLILAIILSAFFSGSEVAIVSVSKLKAQQLVDKGFKNSKTLLFLKNNPSKTLITILIGNNLVNIAGSAIATMLAIKLFPNSGVAIATGVMTFLILTFGEITPKTFATKKAEKVALLVAPIINFLLKLFYPFVWFFYHLSKMSHGGSAVVEEPLVTEEEVRHMVNIGEREGQIKPDEKDMIQRIFLFDDIEVNAVMTPRTDMFALDMNMTVADAIHSIINQEFSRIPVFDKSLDKIKGVVLVKDLLKAIAAGNYMKQLKDFIISPLFVPEHKKINVLLKELQSRKVHMAFVVNEHGGIEGLVTIEDLLEELVGEIFDESDEVENLIKPLGDNKWLVLGKTPISDLNESLDLNIPEDDDFNTVAGLIHKHLGRVPKAGSVCNLRKQGVSLVVKSVDGPVILEVLVEKK